MSPYSRSGFWKGLGFTARKIILPLTLSVLLIFAWITTHDLAPPKAPETERESLEFSVSNVFIHLRAIASVPHPVGSRQNFEVKNYIIKTVSTYGLSADVQTARIGLNADFPPRRVQNISVLKRGINSTRTILLAAHYDSVIWGPGAGDDGVAVACLLECIRVLQNSPPLQNDVLVLFTDGEEFGSLGARAFAYRKDIIDSLGIVCNFDSRGTSGPSIMYETSCKNGSLISELRKSSPYVIGSSLASTIYQFMPNRTDFEIFRSLGVPGLNFGFMSGAAHYHMATDTIDNIDRNTVYHTGVLMLGIARHFGMLAMPLKNTKDSVYFNVLGKWFICYPIWVDYCCLAAITIACAKSMWDREIRSRLQSAFQLFALQSLLPIVGSLAATMCVKIIAPKLNVALPPRNLALLVGALSVFLSAFFYWRIKAATRCQGIVVLAFFSSSIMAVLTSIWAPYAAYVLIWPATFGWSSLLITNYFIKTLHLSLFFSAVIFIIVGFITIGPLTTQMLIAIPKTWPAISGVVCVFVWPTFAAVDCYRRALTLDR